MMPQPVRSELGAYYTPPALCERLLDMATEAGTDWASARVLDPACGGGAFLAPVARRMAASLESSSPESALAEVERRLRGFEVDPFAAWMSEVFLEATLEDLCRRAGRRLRSVVTVCDSLDQAAVGEGYDLVVGNPPYGRVKLSGRLRGSSRAACSGTPTCTEYSRTKRCAWRGRAGSSPTSRRPVFSRESTSRRCADCWRGRPRRRRSVSWESARACSRMCCRRRC